VLILVPSVGIELKTIQGTILFVEDLINLVILGVLLVLFLSVQD
jgi:hypothetical protein